MSEESTDKKYGIEDLQRKLYSQEGGNFKVRRSTLSPNYKNITRTWMDDALNTGSAKSPHSWLVKLFIGSVIFFIGAMALGSYLFFQNSSVISNANIDLSVKGPTEIKAGDQVDLQVLIANKNKVPIKSVQLMSAYATGTRMAGNINQELLHATLDLGEIPSGGVANQTVSALVFGKENETKTITLKLRYSVADSNNFFEKETTYNLKISASPIDLTVDMPSEMNSGENITIRITAMDNSPSPLKNILLGINYPPGFTFKESDVKPSYGNNRWFFGDMESGVVRKITITGMIEGSPEDLKSFNITTGIQGTLNPQNVSIFYNNIFKTLAIKKPFLAITLNGGEKRNLSMEGNASQDFTLTWANNLLTTIVDGVVSLSLDGNVLDKQAVGVARGYYSSYDNVITWNKSTEPSLGAMDPGSTNTLTFKLGTLPLVISENQSLKNPVINLRITIKGTRVSPGFANETIQTDLTKTIKVNTKVELITDALYTSGPFTNTGGVPPQVDKATTYTIKWAVFNSSNDMQNTEAEAVLPPGVTWTNQTSPPNESISYISQDHKVIWRIGYLKGGAGISESPRQAFFQVSLRPSITNIGSNAPLVGAANFQGTDTFTGNHLKLHNEAGLTTYIKNDPQFQYGQDKVTP
ncbi:MAG: hypothetical protein AAB645_01800 [Patescibacteria group bacterium]